MKEDYLITIQGTMEQNGGSDSVQLMTRGSFVKRGGSFFITYKETQATGYEGCVTTVKVEGSDKVSMLRFGPAPSQLVIERGALAWPQTRFTAVFLKKAGACGFLTCWMWMMPA